MSWIGLLDQVPLKLQSTDMIHLMLSYIILNQPYVTPFWMETRDKLTKPSRPYKGGMCWSTLFSILNRKSTPFSIGGFTMRISRLRPLGFAVRRSDRIGICYLNPILNWVRAEQETNPIGLGFNVAG